MIKLIDGRIPANTICPYKNKCNDKLCNHKGLDHQVAFSCASARAFEIMNNPRKTYICEFCGIYTAREPKCNLCIISD